MKQVLKKIDVTDYDKSLKLLGDTIELNLNKLLKIDPQELKTQKQNKYLKIAQ